MENPTSNRIHPLMAAAAASVIIVSLTGAAAITGLLPTSKSAPETMPLAASSPYAMQQPGMNPQYAAQQGQMAMQPVAAQTQQMVPAMLPAMVPAQQVAYAQPLQPVQAQPTVIIKEKPVVKVVEKTRVVHAAPKPVRYEEPRYAQRAPAPAQPNYVGIGTGAVIGGLIGNQVGGGNGKKLATVAGVIGGGIIGNEIANRNR